MLGAQQRAINGYYGSYVLTSERRQDEEFQVLINIDADACLVRSTTAEQETASDGVLDA